VVYWLLLFLFVHFLPAQTAWVKYGWQVFTQAGDARTIALGKAVVAGGPGGASILENPAGNTRHDRRLLSYTHQRRFAGIVNSDLLAYSLRTPAGHPVEFVLLHESVAHIPDTRNLLLDWGRDGIPGTQDVGEGNGILDEGERLDETKLKYFQQRQWGVYLSSAWQWRQWRLGIGLKGLFHALGEHYGSGFGVDIGLLRQLWSGARLGLAVRDVTTSWLVWENGTVERAAPVLLLGLNQQAPVFVLPLKVAVSADLVVNGNGRSLTDDYRLGGFGGAARYGLELTHKNRLRFRLGRNEIRSLVAGLGLDWQVLVIDYAYQSPPPASGLGNSHLISIAVDPQWLSDLLQTRL
jgi:hypothetical protein